MIKIDFDEREIQVLLNSLKEANRVYVSMGGSRDFSWEDEYDALEKKLKKSLLENRG